MGKNGKKAAAGKPKKLTPKDIGKRLDALAKKLEEEVKGADLFAPLPPTDDCALCLLPLSRITANSSYISCCGNFICRGCSGEQQEFVAKQKEKKGGREVGVCPFCREPDPVGNDEVERRLEARAAKGDGIAWHALGRRHSGTHGHPVDDLKALDCYIRAAELGFGAACCTIAICYERGRGVSFDKDMCRLFYKASAKRGHIGAFECLGHLEYNSGNVERGIKYWKFGAEHGHQHSLNELKKIYLAEGKMPGKQFISKDDMDKAYRVCHEAQCKVKSEEREKHNQVDGARC